MSVASVSLGDWHGKKKPKQKNQAHNPQALLSRWLQSYYPSPRSLQPVLHLLCSESPGSSHQRFFTSVVTYALFPKTYVHTGWHLVQGLVQSSD